MNVVDITRSLNPSLGGPVEALKQIAPYLKTQSVSQLVLTLDSPSSPWLTNLPFKVVPLGPALGKYGWEPNVGKAIQEHIKGTDIVNIHGLWQYHGISTYRAVIGQHVPYCVTPHGMLGSWFRDQYPLKHFKKQLYWHYAEKTVVNAASALLFASKYEEEQSRLTFTPCTARSIVVGIGISKPSYEPAAIREQFLMRFSIDCSRKIILFVGRLHPVKGLDILLTAFAAIAKKYPLFHLVIAGPDDIGYQRKLRQLASSFQISDRITWAGMLQGELKWGAFYSADVLCLPSYHESFGVVVAEALSCGIPVIISNQVGISKAVTSFNAGFVHASSSVHLAEALYKWAGLDPIEKIPFRQNARRLFHAELQASQVAKNLSAAYQSIMI